MPLRPGPHACLHILDANEFLSFPGGNRNTAQASSRGGIQADIARIALHQSHFPFARPLTCTRFRVDSRYIDHRLCRNANSTRFPPPPSRFFSPLPARTATATALCVRSRSRAADACGLAWNPLQFHAVASRRKTHRRSRRPSQRRCPQQRAPSLLPSYRSRSQARPCRSRPSRRPSPRRPRTQDLPGGPCLKRSTLSSCAFTPRIFAGPGPATPSSSSAIASATSQASSPGSAFGSISSSISPSPSRASTARSGPRWKSLQPDSPSPVGPPSECSSLALRAQPPSSLPPHFLSAAQPPSFSS